MDSTQRRKAANEAVFREVNERVERLERRLAVASPDDLPVVCECDRLDCVERLSVSVETYERVRADAHCFIVAPGHADASVEDVIDGGGAYLVVRKRPGEPQAIAEQTDPRG